MQSSKLILFILAIAIFYPQSGSAQQKRIPISAYDKNTILTYGLGSYQRQNAERIIAPKWGIKFVQVAGCVVTQAITDSIDVHNKVVYRNMEKKYGKDWKKQFDDEINEEIRRENIVRETVKQISFIIHKNKELKQANDYLDYDVTPVHRSDDYIVSAGCWDRKKEQWITYYTIKVNYKTRRYTLIRDKAEE